MVVGQDKEIGFVLVVRQMLGLNESSALEEDLLRECLKVARKVLPEEHHDLVSFDLDMEDEDLHNLVETSQVGCCTFHEHLMKVVAQVHLVDHQEVP